MDGWMDVECISNCLMGELLSDQQSCGSFNVKYNDVVVYYCGNLWRNGGTLVTTNNDNESNEVVVDTA